VALRFGRPRRLWADVDNAAFGGAVCSAGRQHDMGVTEQGRDVWRRIRAHQPIGAASLLDDLRSLVEPATRGDPQSPLLWTCKSLRKLAESLRGMGHKIGRTLVGELLHKLDYSLQANRKTREGSNHADRDAQFHYINLNPPVGVGRAADFCDFSTESCCVSQARGVAVSATDGPEGKLGRLS